MNSTTTNISSDYGLWLRKLNLKKIRGKSKHKQLKKSLTLKVYKIQKPTSHAKTNTTQWRI